MRGESRKSKLCFLWNSSLFMKFLDVCNDAILCSRVRLVLVFKLFSIVCHKVFYTNMKYGSIQINSKNKELLQNIVLSNNKACIKSDFDAFLVRDSKIKLFP